MKKCCDQVTIDKYKRLSCFGFYLIRQILASKIGIKKNGIRELIDSNSNAKRLNEVANLAYAFHNLNEEIVRCDGIDEENLWKNLDNVEIEYPKIVKGGFRKAFSAISENDKISVHQLIHICSIV